MKKRELLAILLVLVLSVGLFVGCSNQNNDQTPVNNDNEGTKTFEDGKYFAMEDKFSEQSGWKSAVTLEVKDGKIISVDWNGVSIKAGLTKKEASKAGAYPMVEVGKAQAPWHEQAEKVEAYLIETQDPTAIEYKDDEGHTDAISGVSIHVNDFYALVEKALADGPQEMGTYKDGAYHAEEDAFNNGWKGTVDLTVLFGNIVSVNWSAINEEDQELDKKTASIEGNYPMVEVGKAQAPWHEQAQMVEAYLLETQDPTAIEYKDDEGHTDAIAGVSIHVNDFYALVNEALENAK